MSNNERGDEMKASAGEDSSLPAPSHLPRPQPRLTVADPRHVRAQPLQQGVGGVHGPLGRFIPWGERGADFDMGNGQYRPPLRLSWRHLFSFCFHMGERRRLGEGSEGSQSRAGFLRGSVGI